MREPIFEDFCCNHLYFSHGFTWEHGFGPLGYMVDLHVLLGDLTLVILERTSHYFVVDIQLELWFTRGYHSRKVHT
jgi:hypothetical protein